MARRGPRSPAWTEPTCRGRSTAASTTLVWVATTTLGTSRCATQRAREPVSSDGSTRGCVKRRPPNRVARSPHRTRPASIKPLVTSNGRSPSGSSTTCGPQAVVLVAEARRSRVASVARRAFRHTRVSDAGRRSESGDVGRDRARSMTIAGGRRARSRTRRGRTTGARSRRDGEPSTGAHTRTLASNSNSSHHHSPSSDGANDVPHRRRVARRNERLRLYEHHPSARTHQIAGDDEEQPRRVGVRACDRVERGRQRAAADRRPFELVQERRVADDGIEPTAPPSLHRRARRRPPGGREDRRRDHATIASRVAATAAGSMSHPHSRSRATVARRQSSANEQRSAAASRNAPSPHAGSHTAGVAVEAVERELDEPVGHIGRCVERAQLTSSCGRQTAPTPA